MKTAEFFRNRKVRRVAVVLASIVLVYGGLRLYGWAEPRIYYASLDRQEWREDMEPGEYFPPVPPDAKGPPRSMEMWHYLPDSSRWVDSEHIRKMIDRETIWICGNLTQRYQSAIQGAAYIPIRCSG